MALKISLGTMQVTISQLRDPKLPRVKLNPMTAELTARGFLAVKGSSVASKNTWIVAARMDRPSALMLIAIAEESDALRRLGQDPQLIVEDTWQMYCERPPATRPIVAGTTSIATGDLTCYYTQFKAIFTKPPEIVNSSSFLYEVDFDLMEGDSL